MSLGEVGGREGGAGPHQLLLPGNYSLEESPLPLVASSIIGFWQQGTRSCLMSQHKARSQPLKCERFQPDWEKGVGSGTPFKCRFELFTRGQTAALPRPQQRRRRGPLDFTLAVFFPACPGGQPVEGIRYLLPKTPTPHPPFSFRGANPIVLPRRPPVGGGWLGTLGAATAKQSSCYHTHRLRTLRSTVRELGAFSAALRGRASSMGHSVQLLFRLAKAGGGLPGSLLLRAVMLVGLKSLQLREKVTS